jgi:hypothetical protein
LAVDGSAFAQVDALDLAPSRARVHQQERLPGAAQLRLSTPVRCTVRPGVPRVRLPRDRPGICPPRQDDARPPR